MTAIFPRDTLLWEALPELTLNIAQTADLCGISVRPLDCWIRQGHVTASGQGARRTYRLTAIRRAPAVRKAMEADASLRQALHQIAGEVPTSLTNSTEPPAVSAPIPAVAAKAADLQRSLILLFAANCYVRDHAGGLAVKLGLAEENTFSAADSLCASVFFRAMCVKA